MCQQYFHVVLFILFYKVRLNFLDRMEFWSEDIWAVLSFGPVYLIQGPKILLVWPFKWNLLGSNFLQNFSLCCTSFQTFESVDKTLKCGDSLKASEQFFHALQAIIFYYLLFLFHWQEQDV